jgi:hypothetical protein
VTYPTPSHQHRQTVREIARFKTPEIVEYAREVRPASGDIPTLSGFASPWNAASVDFEGPFACFGKASQSRNPNGILAVFRNPDADARSIRE